MTNWRLDHVQLAIPPGSEEVCDAFYVELLGFDIEAKPPLLAVRGGRWYRRSEAVVHLGVETDFRPARKAHPALVVDDYDELIERLRSAQIQVRESNEVPGTVRCHVTDPVGNRLELIDARTAR
jgi:catechol 2,3-dioxygenase-like lactoylglutathione lyase family enzyme